MILNKIFVLLLKIKKWSWIFFNRYSDYIFNYGDPRKNIRYKNNSTIIHKGGRSVLKLIITKNGAFAKKIFTNSPEGLAAFYNEKKANKLFTYYPWFIPWTKTGLKSFTTPYHSFGVSLYHIGPQLTRDKQLEIAGQIMEIVLDLYNAGYAHRDLRANNIILIGDQVKLIDFEWLLKYGKSKQGVFTEHYDITSKGLPGFLNIAPMCYNSTAPDSISSVINVNLDEALNALKNILLRKLHIASGSFHNYRDGRRITKNKIYASFSLPGFRVKPSDTLRNTRIRLAKFGVTNDMIKGKKILNLGSNTGAINFETYKFNPFKSVGIEFDYDKVEISRKITSYCSITNIDFISGDLDYMKLEEIGTGYDVVFCLAVVEHVKYPDRLFELLGKVNSGVLFYEGDSKEFISEEDKIMYTKRQLSKVGYKNVEYLGLCQDDINPELNIRPLFHAYK